MDAERYSGIDFANSKSDSYNATNADVMSELNAYFKSYIANVGGNDERDLQKTLDGILHESTFDDAIDAIHRGQSDKDSDNDSEKLSDYNDTGMQNMLDVEILDQHIDKHGLTGGSDATRAIENMAGGALNDEPPFEGEKDEHDATHEDFANNMLGMQGGDVRLGKTSAMKGYSGVTNEIRVKGNRVSERSRNAYNYRDEDGRLDMGMLCGSFEGAAESDGEDEESHKKDNIILIGTKDSSDEDKNGYESEYGEYSDEEHESPSHSMASEIDLVLNQLRNKTARTLTGGTVNIRKKVVLTDMYPYIVRS